jgi:hypothetical protein
VCEATARAVVQVRLMLLYAVVCCCMLLLHAFGPSWSCFSPVAKHISWCW